MKKGFLTTILCIFIAIVLAMGGALGLAAAIKSARSVVNCGDITADLGTVTYLASYYKTIYLSSLSSADIDASDTEEFWSSPAEGGKSWGELFTIAFKDYVTSLVAAANIYTTYSGYTPEDKLRVADTCNSVLQDKAGGSVSEFNEKAEKYGFDFNDFQNAAALIYKARGAADVTAHLSAEELSDAYDTVLSKVSFSDRFDAIDPLAPPADGEFYIENFK